MRGSRQVALVLVASLWWLWAACVAPAAAGPAPSPPPPPGAPAPSAPTTRAPAAGTAHAPAPVAREIVLSPTGDHTGASDAAALQRALTGAAPGTVIRLAAGDFYLGHALVADGFVGTLRGAGMDATTVHVTGTIRHFAPDEGDCRGTRIDGSLHTRPTPANPWPFVLSVLGGDLTLSDLTFTTVPGATARFCIFQQPVSAIAGYVVVTGPATGSRILRVRFVGHAGTFEGYDVIQATYLEGLLYGGSDDWALPVTGRHLVEGCDFEHVFAGSSVENAAQSSILELRHNTYGGAPGLPLVEGLEVWSSAGQVRFEENEVHAAGEAVVVVQGLSEKLGILEQSGRLVLVAAHNRIFAEAGSLAAFDLTDLKPALFGVHGLGVEVRDNRVVLSGARYGVIGNGLAGARLVGNTFEGHATRDGIDLGAPEPESAYGVTFPPAAYPTVGCRLEGNDLTRLTAGRHPVALGPFTRGCVVVGRARVVDEGRGNRVVRP